NFATLTNNIMIDKAIGYSKENTMREVLRDNSLLVKTIGRFGLAFGFGDDTVASICSKNGVDTATFLAVCNLLSGYPYESGSVSLQSLADYLKKAHSGFLEITLPRIRLHLIEAINHTTPNEVEILFMRFYDEYVEEVTRHMNYENEVVFPYVERLTKGEIDGNFNINRYSENHDNAATKLNELKDLFIYHYTQRENPKLSETLFDIVMCEKDLVSHFEIESKLFVPEVARLENALRDNTGRKPSTNTCPDPHREPEESISEREKEIIRCVASGKSNKEIAEELFISPHTVATHRRNINAKLGIHSSAGLTIYAIIHHIIDAKEVKL
ncbi:MAG: helix-turn-helix transcriptional regulator, partial [Muribaculaceae bacterium]|nr:helix-turn-helix transcriptional regulator [Muribaculaceae bacterium]